MPKHYRLCLMSLKKLGNINECRNSVHMMTWGIWNEFAKLKHVELEFQSIYEPLSVRCPDFVLFHACFGEHAFSRLAEIRKHVKYKTILFMELPLSTTHVDYCFTYLPQATYQHCEEISLPCLSSVLDQHSTSKKPGNILLDHIWPSYCGTNKELSPRLYDWLEPYKNRFSISQLRRCGCAASENFPKWIIPIEEKPYTDYLDATSYFETYILTHPGSYEHSVIDMAYRGTRVLVPVVDGHPFIHKSTIERLNLSTFSTQFELTALLERPVRIADKRQSFSDMSKVVSSIDTYCQKELSWI
ncbi:MAG: hypothetical protein WC919_06480 [Candidatus Paceibacterota bacterium]|jgi:hypothetical protein